jgi:hypothetical protein
MKRRQTRSVLGERRYDLDQSIVLIVAMLSGISHTK